MQVCNSAQEVECFGWRGKADAAYISLVVELGYLDLHVYLHAIIAAICSLRECVFMDAASERSKALFCSEPARTRSFL